MFLPHPPARQPRPQEFRHVHLDRPAHGRCRRDAQIDPRGQQFAAAVTAVVLAVVLLLAPRPSRSALLAVQARRCSRSAPGSASSAPRTPGCSGPWSGPGSAPPAELEDAAPPRFAQAVGLVFALVGAASASSPAPPLLGLVATGFALVAALLNAVFGFCLGCEMYLLIRRVRRLDHRADPNEPRRTTRTQKGDTT